jgi:signal transduction histidine kinase
MLRCLPSALQTLGEEGNLKERADGSERQVVGRRRLELKLWPHGSDEDHTRMPGSHHLDSREAAVTESVDGVFSLFLNRLASVGIGSWNSDSRWSAESPSIAMRAQLRILAAALIALALTGVLQAFSFSVHTLSGHTAVETATGLVGALGAGVFAERTRSSRLLGDFLTALSLGMLSATDLILGAGPTLIDSSPGNACRWIGLVCRLVAGAILIGAAFYPRLSIDRPRFSPRAILAASIGAVTVFAGAALLWRSHLPSLIEAGGSSRTGFGDLLGWLELVGALLAAIAAIGLARQAGRGTDPLVRSLAAGVSVLAIARFNYFLLPPVHIAGRLYAGDVLKLGAYLLILYGCMAEFRATQRKLVRRVAMDERRRMARDMHDGLAQELAFIASYSQRLGQTGDDAATVAHLRAAAERALHDSRTAIAVLTSAEEAPLDVLIARTADSFRSRFGVEVELDLENEVLVEAEWRNALLRILHEASTNAIRHGGAERIRVRMRNGPHGPSLRVADDGVGFDVQAAVADAGGGLGLTSMRERAEMLGARLSISSSPGAGAVVEVGAS